MNISKAALSKQNWFIHSLEKFKIAPKSPQKPEIYKEIFNAWHFIFKVAVIFLYLERENLF